MTDEGSGVRFDFEVREVGPQVVGRIVPGDGSVVLDQLDNQLSQELEPDGTFEFTIRPGQPFRMRYVSPDGAMVATDWIE